MSKNLCSKTVEPENAYEVWANADHTWIFWVLKKYQTPEKEAENPYARWLCAVSSPLTYGNREIGDTYVVDVKTGNHQILNPLVPLLEARKPYSVTPDPFWAGLPMLGGDGYDDMEEAELRGWHAISGWGKDGWNLGSWPYVIVFFRHKDGKYQVAEYCEGDVVQWDCPNRWIRQQITDGIAFWHWKHADEEWAKAYDSIDKVPLDSELRGPYRA